MKYAALLLAVLAGMANAQINGSPSTSSSSNAYNYLSGPLMSGTNNSSSNWSCVPERDPMSGRYVMKDPNCLPMGSSSTEQGYCRIEFRAHAALEPAVVEIPATRKECIGTIGRMHGRDPLTTGYFKSK